MVSRCCVPLCDFVPGTSIHKFPARDENLRAKWILAISREGMKPGTLWMPDKDSKICGKHFKPSDFSLSTNNRRLLPYAVPSIFSYVPFYGRLVQSDPKLSTEARLRLEAKQITPDVSTSNNQLNNEEYGHITDEAERNNSDHISASVIEKRKNKYVRRVINSSEQSCKTKQKAEEVFPRYLKVIRTLIKRNKSQHRQIAELTKRLMKLEKYVSLVMKFRRPYR